MRLVIELDGADYEESANAENFVMVEPITVVEIRQAGGLLCEERSLAYFDFVARSAAPEGTADGGPVIRAYVRKKEEG